MVQTVFAMLNQQQWRHTQHLYLAVSLRRLSSFPKSIGTVGFLHHQCLLIEIGSYHNKIKCKTNVLFYPCSFRS